MLPTSTDVKLNVKEAVPAGSEAVVLFLAEESTDAKRFKPLGAEDRAAFDRLLAGRVVRGKAREVGFDIVDAGKGKFRRVYAAGLGKPEKLTPESVRQAAGAVVRALKKHRLSRVALLIPDLKKVDRSAGCRGSSPALFWLHLISRSIAAPVASRDDSPRNPVLDITIVTDRELAQTRAAVAEAKAIADGQNFARTIASRPGNDINPPTLAKVARRQMAKEVGLTCRVLDEKEMAQARHGRHSRRWRGKHDTPPRHDRAGTSSRRRSARRKRGPPRRCWSSARRSPSTPAASPSKPPTKWGE